jgi:hypothetical protein
VDETTEDKPEPIMRPDGIEQTLLTLHEAGEAEPPDYWWWQSHLDV